MIEPKLPKDVPRYAPARALPPYRFIPGRGLPHPINDPAGHSYQEHPDQPSEPWTVESWPRLEDWLVGVDLFNHAYWWESHEAFEGLWQVAPTPETTELLQGLIQIAVALLKSYQGQRRPARSLLERGRMRFASLPVEPACLMGVDRGQLLRDADEYIQARSRGERGRAPTIRLS